MEATGMGEPVMTDVATSTTAELLQYLHEVLDGHFTSVKKSRDTLDPRSPVFALEHGLPAEDLDLLLSTVRASVAAGLSARHRRWWLPYVVYAAESGYDYSGGEFWRSFEETTPGWRVEHRSWIKTWFQKFA